MNNWLKVACWFSLSIALSFPTAWLLVHDGWWTVPAFTWMLLATGACLFKGIEATA